MISSYFHHVSIIFPSSYLHHHISIIDTSYFHHIPIIDIINFFLHPQDLSRRFPTLSGHDQGSHGTLGDGSVPSVRPLLAIFGLRLVEASEVRKSWGNPWEYRNIHYKWRHESESSIYHPTNIQGYISSFFCFVMYPLHHPSHVWLGWPWHTIATYDDLGITHV